VKIWREKRARVWGFKGKGGIRNRHLSRGNQRHHYNRVGEGDVSIIQTGKNGKTTKMEGKVGRAVSTTKKRKNVSVQDPLKRKAFWEGNKGTYVRGSPPVGQKKKKTTDA